MNVSEEIRDCYKHAENCARQAAAQTDPELRENFLALPVERHRRASVANVLFIEPHRRLSVFAKIRLLTGHPSF
jgi:hypothetical protein